VTRDRSDTTVPPRFGKARVEVQADGMNSSSRSGRTRLAPDAITLIPVDPRLVAVKRTPLAQRAEVMIDDPHPPGFAALVQDQGQ